MIKLAVILFMIFPLAILGAGILGFAFQKYPASENAGWCAIKKNLERAKMRLERVLGFLMITAFAAVVLRVTGGWDLFLNPDGIDDWPWYNFVALVLGFLFAGYLVFCGLQFLGERSRRR